MKHTTTSKEDARELRQNLRRDPQFKRELAEAYGVSEVPKELHEKLEQTYLSLPDELIVKKKPWRTAVTRTMGTLAAAAAVFALLIGLGVISPAVLQKVPGFGQFFGNTSSVAEYAIPDGFSQLPVTDNGTILYALETESTGTDTTLTVSAVIPYMGQESYDVTRYMDSTPYGVYAVFSAFNQWNTVIKAEPDSISNQQPSETDSRLLYTEGDAMGISDAFTVQWQIKLSQLKLSNGGQMTLTLYELQEPTSHINHVTAEFTIDIASLSAQASTNYEEQGFEKITPEECLAKQRNDAVTVTRCAPVVVGENETVFMIAELFINMAEIGADPELVVHYQNGGDPFTFRVDALDCVHDVTDPLLVNLKTGGGEWYRSDGCMIWQEYPDSRRTGGTYNHLIFVITSDIVSGDLTEIQEALSNGNLHMFLQAHETGEMITENVYFAQALPQHDPQ